MARIKSARAASASRSPVQAATTAISASMQSPEKHKNSFCPGMATLPDAQLAHATGCKEIVFIDQGVEDYSHLVAAARDGVMVHVIDSSRDGVRQMSAILQQQSGLSAVHIVSHGSAGCLALGNSLLTVETLERYRGDLFAWQQALKNHAEILLYGCNVGQGTLGEYFVRQLADMTGANIAASTTLTGHAGKQGDWELAFTIGEIKCPIAFADNLVATYPGVLVTVENYDVDPGLGSFPTSFELNGFVYAFTDEGDEGDFGWINQYGVGDSGFVSPGSLGASNTGTTESFTIRKSDGTPFLFKEIWIFAELDDVTVAGMLNGSTIDSTIISAGDSWAAASFSVDGAVVDTLKISSVDFIPNLDGIDNFTYSLTLPNASPSLTINNDNSLLYTENDTATQIDASAILNDPDGDADWDGGTLTVQITGNAEAADRLSIVDDVVGSIRTNGTNLLDDATVIGTLSAAEGTVSGGTMLTIAFNDQATNARVQQVVQAIHYHNDSNDPGTGDRTITFTATDRHDGAASGTRTVAITAINDAPTLTADAVTENFTEGGAAVSLFSGTAIDAVEAGDKIVELVLTVTQVTDGAHEVLTIDGSGVSLTHDNSVAATATHAMAVGVVVAGTTATVTISKAGGITPAEAQTLVNAIAYSNTSQNPTAADRVITLTSIQDSGGTADGGVDTTVLAIASTVTVVPVNDPPEIGNLDGDAVSFSVGGAAVALDENADVTLTDVDTSVFAGGNVTAAITANGQSAEDELLVGNVGPISLSGSEVVHTDGVTIGTVTGGTEGESLVVTLNADATVARVQDLLTALQYVNTDPATVNTDPRTVSVTVDDGEDEHSTSSVQSITVTLVRAPIIDLDSDGSTFTFTEKGGAVALAGTNATISDDGSFKSLTVTLTNRPDSTAESLSSTYGTGPQTVNGEAVTIAAYDHADGMLHISVNDGSASEATMQLLIQSIRYDNTSNDPDVTDRSITFSATDNDDHIGPPVTATLNMVAVNDPPTLTATGENPTFSQGGAAVSLFSDAAASTVESGQSLKQLIITVTNVTDGDGANEWLSVDGQGIALSDSNLGTTVAAGITYDVTWASNTATLTLTKAGMSAAEVQALINGLSYHNTSTPPGDSTRVVTLTSLKDDGGTADGGADTAELSIASTVSVTPYPTLSSATYDAATGTLIVTGAHIQANDGGDDVDVSKLTLTGEGGETYTLTDSANVDRDSDTQFTVTLSAADRAALNQIINKDGTASTSGTVYNLAAADDWNTAVTDGDTADMTGNGITVSHVPVPAITSATYDASTGILVVTGTDFVKLDGAANDIDVSKLAFTGEGGESYTLTSDNVDITSGTAFTVTLNDADRVAVNLFLNKNGVDSTGGTPYNLAAAENWAAGADAAVAVADLTGNGITVSNVAVPAITAATYDAGTGVLVVTGTDFLKLDGAANDIDVSKLTITGQGGATHTLTDTANVEITSSTSFSVTLSATDKTAVNQIINRAGTASVDDTVYNLAAAEGWAAGAYAAVNVADLTGNGITATLPPPSSGGGGGTAPPAVPTTATVDGMPVTIIKQSDGAVLLTVPVVGGNWENDPTTSSHEHADIPVVTDVQGKPVLTVGLPIGVGLRTAGQLQAQNTSSAAEDLAARIQNKITPGSASGQAMMAHARQFIDTLEFGSAVHVHTLELIADASQRAEVPVMITGSADLASGKQLLVIDGSNLPAGTVLQLDDIAFAAVSGPVHLMGGQGRNFVTADGQDQVIILGADDDILFGGDGNDIVGSLGGDDFVSGGAGDDVVFGGTGNDILHGGPGNDRLNGGFGFDMALQEGVLADYEVTIRGHEVILRHRNGESDSLVDVELVRFDSGPSLAIAYSAAEAAAHHLVKTWLERDLTPAEGNALQNWRDAEVDEIVAAFLNLPEAADLREKTSDELLAGLASNPYVIQLDVVREYIGSDGNDQGYLPLGLAMHVDGGAGHDVLRMAGGRDAVHLELVGDVVELTRLSDGAMLGLKNAEAIAFDSGETVLFAHNTTEGILGRLFRSFFNRDATSAEWQLGREALAAQVDPDMILDWFQERAELAVLTDADYIQTLYWQTYGRQATGSELQAQLLRLENETIDRPWLAVEIAASDEAIDLVGNVMLTEGWI
ncbi:MAG: DUF4347 domain-containing protein [Nitrosomonas halophila]